MKRMLILTSFILASSVLLISSSALAEGFSADMSWKEVGKEDRISKFYLSGNLYTYDLADNGQKMRLIVDREAGMTKILNLDEKVFMEMPNNNFFITMNNPFEAHEAMLKQFKQYKVFNEGEEEINGLNCEKRAIKWKAKTTVGDKIEEEQEIVISRAWVSKKYNIPIKLINYKGDKEHLVVELTNIKEGKISEDVFQVPGDFKKHEMK